MFSHARVIFIGVSSVVCPGYSHLLKYLFGICLCPLLISLSNLSIQLQNGPFPIFSLFCYHSNGKSQSNLKLLHFGYCSYKLVKNNIYILAS